MPETEIVPGPLAIYVHWPFCRAKCPYCDFNSHIREMIDEERWRRALLTEIQHTAEETQGRRVGSIFFGGGTPSLMAPETVAATIDHIDKIWRLDSDAEITLEANPTSVEAGRFAGYHAAGINRLSLGVQALDNEALAFLGRQHTVAEALDALETARAAFPRYSFDLIYARPEQSIESWQRELAAALTIVGDHISLYQLTIEKGTSFHASVRNGEIILPPETLAAQLFEITQQATEDAGFSAYEVSNHARPGGESRHNLSYWHYDDYAGIGPGAHGRLTLAKEGRIATRRHAKPETWLEAVDRNGHGNAQRHEVSAMDSAREMLMMGLRLKAGVDLKSLKERTGLTLAETVNLSALERFSIGGFLVNGKESLRATGKGRAVLNSLLAKLLV